MTDIIASLQDRQEKFCRRAIYGTIDGSRNTIFSWWKTPSGHVELKTVVMNTYYNLKKPVPFLAFSRTATKWGSVSGTGHLLTNSNVRIDYCEHVEPTRTLNKLEYHWHMSEYEFFDNFIIYPCWYHWAFSADDLVWIGVKWCLGFTVDFCPSGPTEEEWIALSSG